VATPIGSAIATDPKTLAAASDGTRLYAFYLSTQPGPPDHLRTFNLVDGSLLIDQGVPASADTSQRDNNDPIYDSMVAAPGGRRIYWLTGFEDNRRLLTVVLDPETGKVAGEEPPLQMPGGSRDLRIFPDGEALLVLDAKLDQVLLFH
jgi:hypothetical protein